MEIIKDYNNDCYLNQTGTKQETGKNNQTEFNKKFKIADYFDYIYSYPPKIKIKWDGLDELKDDFFISSKGNSIDYSIPIIDFIEDRGFVKIPEEALANKYPISNYFDGFLNKANSSNFFLKKTKEIQSTLTNIPIYVVLNGQREIILNKPANVLKSKNPNTYLNEKVYDQCGGFDPVVEKKSELGLFFMNYLDAEKYLKEVARSDFEGTNVVSLSIHCINLSSAYQITREYHPGIDFRFVPNFKEVKELLTNSIGKSDMIIENEQQQLRFRPRNVNFFPYLNKLGNYISPKISLLQRNEYFKGVPIYIVQVSGKPETLVNEQYFRIIGKLDSIYSRCLQSLDYLTGFGHNWIMEGSLKDQNFKNSKNSENYIFFEKNQAIEFCKKNKRNISRYIGGRTANLESIIRKPKILVYNLEDFLEDWEDNINEKLTIKKESFKTLFDSKCNNFVMPTNNVNEINNFPEKNKNNFIKNMAQTLNIKMRVFKSTVGIFFSL
jgi:hypothetical protein